MSIIKPGASPPPPHLLGILQTIYRWRRPILLVTLTGTVLAVVVSLLLPVYYSSTTTFLTISPDQVSIEGVFGNEAGRMQFYGTGDDIDRVMAVAESDDLVDFMVDSFKLYRVYDIDSSKQKAPVYVRREFLSLYEVEKTPRDAIELTLQDRDPVRAAAMARAARERINHISLELIRNTQRRSAGGLRSEVASREVNLADLNQRLSQLRERYGIYNTEAQSEALATLRTTTEGRMASATARLEAYRRRGGRGARDSIAKLEVLLEGLTSGSASLDSQLVRLNASIGPLDNLEEERKDLNDALTEDRIRLKQFETILRSDQRAIEVVEEAKVPVVKSYPLRSLIVVGAAAFSFLVAVVGALLIDSGRRYDWGAVFTDE